METQQANDDYLAEVKCDLLGPRMEFRGTWEVGFEVSLFQPSQTASSKLTADYYELIVPKTIDALGHAHDSTVTPHFKLRSSGDGRSS